MKQLEVFNKIGGILKELNDQYKYIEANPADLNELELELFIANAHFLADHAEILGKMNQKIKADKYVAKKEGNSEKYFEPFVQPLNPEAGGAYILAEPAERPRGYFDLPPNAPEDNYSYRSQEPEVIKHELVIDEEQAFDGESADGEGQTPPEKPKEFTAAEETVVPVNLNEVKTAAKKEPGTKEEVITINQKISSQMGNKGSITEQANVQPVSNLKQAITLNDKLLYVKELFNGYSLAYSEAIEILNRYNTFEEAERFLNNNYATKNDWANKPDTTEKFYELLKRRYN